MSVVATSVAAWLQIVRGEFHEIPGLHLTKPQVRRLWGLDEPTCDALLAVLVEARFFERRASGAYARIDVGR